MLRGDLRCPKLVGSADFQLCILARLGGDWANAGTAMTIHDVLVELVLINLHEGHQWNWSNLAKTAEAELDNVLAGALDQSKVFQRSSSKPDAVENFDERRVTESAWNTLATTLVAAEGSEIASHVDGTYVVVEKDPATGSEHSVDFVQ